MYLIGKVDGVDRTNVSMFENVSAKCLDPRADENGLSNFCELHFQQSLKPISRLQS